MRQLQRFSLQPWLYSLSLSSIAMLIADRWHFSCIWQGYPGYGIPMVTGMKWVCIWGLRSILMGLWGFMNGCEIQLERFKHGVNVIVDA